MSRTQRAKPSRSPEKEDSLRDEAPFEQIELVAIRVLSAPPQDGYLGGRSDVVPRSERALCFTRSPFDLVPLRRGGRVLFCTLGAAPLRGRPSLTLRRARVGGRWSLRRDKVLLVEIDRELVCIGAERESSAHGKPKSASLTAGCGCTLLREEQTSRGDCHVTLVPR